MNLKDGANVVADLITIGRKTGQRRRVELRFLYFGGNFYATSSRVEGKHWCQNMLRSPHVEMKVDGETFPCTAEQVIDDGQRRKLLAIRDSPPQLERVVFEIRPNQ